MEKIGSWEVGKLKIYWGELEHVEVVRLKGMKIPSALGTGP